MLKIGSMNKYFCSILVLNAIFTSAYQFSSIRSKFSSKLVATELILPSRQFIRPSLLFQSKYPELSLQAVKGIAGSYPPKPTPKPKGLIKKVSTFFGSTIGSIFKFLVYLFKSAINIFKKRKPDPFVPANYTNILKPIEVSAPVISAQPIISPTIKKAVDPSASRILSPREIDEARRVVAKKLKEIENLERFTTLKQAVSQAAPVAVPAVSVTSNKVEGSSVAVLEQVTKLSNEEDHFQDPATSVKLMIYAKRPLSLPSTSSPTMESRTEPSISIATKFESVSAESISMTPTSSTIVTSTSADMMSSQPIEITSTATSQSSPHPTTASAKPKSKEAEEIIKTFTAVVSDTTSDPLYLQHETGPIDTISTVEGVDQSPSLFNRIPLESTQAQPADLLPIVDPMMLTSRDAQSDPKTVTVELPSLPTFLSMESLLSLKDNITTTGISGAIANAITELGFWAANIPLIMAASAHDLLHSDNSTVNKLTMM